MISLLPNRSVIAVSGEDAREFLQGLITNDIRKVTADTPIFAAILTPQGKFLYDFFIIEHHGKLFLDVAKATRAELVKRLTMYKLRSKVDIAELSWMQVAVAWGNSDIAGEVKFTDPRLSALGVRVLGSVLKAEANDAYEHHRISLGVPEGGRDLESNDSFPMQWAYDKLNAVDFNKGCYVGQEVTARAKHIGTVRKRPYKIQASSTLPAAGAPIMTEGKEAGKMATSIGNTGVALLNIEAVSGQLSCEGMHVQAEMPVWAKA